MWRHYLSACSGFAIIIVLRAIKEFRQFFPSPEANPILRYFANVNSQEGQRETQKEMDAGHW